MRWIFNLREARALCTLKPMGEGTALGIWSQASHDLIATVLHSLRLNFATSSSGTELPTLPTRHMVLEGVKWCGAGHTAHFPVRMEYGFDAVSFDAHFHLT